MINLLDSASKRNLKAARMNVILATYCAIVAIGLVCVIILYGFSNWMLASKEHAALVEKAKNEAVTAPYAAVQTEADTFKRNLGKIQSLLTNRSHYSVALINIAASLPAGAHLTSISLSDKFLTTPLRISASVASNPAASALQQQLSKAKIYSAVTLDNVTCNTDASNQCTVSLTATLNSTVFSEGAV